MAVLILVFSFTGILTLIATVYGDGYGGYGGGKSDSDGRESANCSAPFPDKYNGNCYNISSVEVNATSARKMCHDLGGDLAKLDGTTSEERQSFAEFIGMGDIWIGLRNYRAHIGDTDLRDRDDLQNANFRWLIDDSRARDYRKFVEADDWQSASVNCTGYLTSSGDVHCHVEENTERFYVCQQIEMSTRTKSGASPNGTARSTNPMTNMTTTTLTSTTADTPIVTSPQPVYFMPNPYPQPASLTKVIQGSKPAEDCTRYRLMPNRSFSTDPTAAIESKIDVDEIHCLNGCSHDDGCKAVIYMENRICMLLSGHGQVNQLADTDGSFGFAYVKVKTNRAL